MSVCVAAISFIDVYCKDLVELTYLKVLVGMPGVAGKHGNGENEASIAEQNAASSKLQAMMRAKRDRKAARKKRASMNYQKHQEITQTNNFASSDGSTSKVASFQSHASSDGTHPQQNNEKWVVSWDPYYKANYYYNVETEECLWDPPAGWQSSANSDVVSNIESKQNQREYSYGSRSGGISAQIPIQSNSTIVVGSVASTSASVPPGIFNENVSGMEMDHVERTATGPQRQRAATKIQSIARGRLGRRELQAMKEVERIGHLRRRGLPPNEDFRAAGNKLRAEIKQSRYLVAMKEKRIQQLEQAMDDAKEEEELRKQEMASLQRKLDLERDEVKGLEVTLGKQRDNCKNLEEQLSQREKELGRCKREMKEQAEALEQAKKMLARRDKTIARKDEQIANMSPDTEDVCLSARSFSENMMISLRDDAIDAKEKQLALLNAQNENLSENITRVENEVEKMQKDMIEKDAELTRRRKKISHQANQIDRLERALQKKGGEEAAIEITNKQNANLLVLLQQHEAKTESLEEARTELEEELAGLRKRHEDLMKKSADFEAQVLTLGSEVEKYKRDLTTGAMEWTGQRAQMTAELEETKRVARVRIDAMQEELRTRREKQYSMLSRLQAADEALRASQDESEQLREVRSTPHISLCPSESNTYKYLFPQQCTYLSYYKLHCQPNNRLRL